MPDRKKVIKGLEYCITHYNCRDNRKPDCPYLDLCEPIKDATGNTLMRDALALLKEQEPKPIAYTDNPYTGLPVARCPKCGKFARQFHAATDEETHFCPWCGQAVKWDE